MDGKNHDHYAYHEENHHLQCLVLLSCTPAGVQWLDISKREMTPHFSKTMNPTSRSREPHGECREPRLQHCAPPPVLRASKQHVRYRPLPF